MTTYNINLSRPELRTILPKNLDKSRNEGEFSHKNTINLNSQSQWIDTGRQSTYSKMATVIKPGMQNQSISNGSTINTQKRNYGKSSDFYVDDSKYIVTNTTQLRLKHPDLDSYVEISIKQRKTPIMSIPHHLASKAQ